METVFVSIASYRDDVCNSTLRDLYKTAKNPKNVFVGICQQNDKLDPDCVPKDFKYNANVRVIRMPYHNAKGPTYARYLCSTLCNGETYYMQIDSHTKFTNNWDEKCIQMIKDIKQQSLSKKPVLSSYPMTIDDYTPDDQSTTVPTMCKSFFNERGMISFLGAETIDQKGKYARNPYMASGFLFCESYFLNELPYDPTLDYLFVGEEISHSIRFYTWGWDIFTPTKNIVYHEYTRSEKPKIWTDVEYTDEQAFEKIKLLLKIEHDKTKVPGHMLKNIKEYGLGPVRTLEDYYNFAGIHLKEQQTVKNFCNGTVEKLKTSSRYDKNRHYHRVCCTLMLNLVIFMLVIIALPI
jgi:hypothetical protein